MDKNDAEAFISLVGAWKLVSFQVRDDKGELTFPFGENAQGAIIYTASGRYIAQVLHPLAMLSADDATQGTPEEFKAIATSCIAYYGEYEFRSEDAVVVHHVEVALFPDLKGDTVERHVELSGDRLRLTTPPTLRGGGEFVGILDWERIG